MSAFGVIIRNGDGGVDDSSLQTNPIGPSRFCSEGQQPFGVVLHLSNLGDFVIITASQIFSCCYY